MHKPEESVLTFEVKITDLTLTRAQQDELAEKLRAAVVLVSQKPITCKQVKASPKAP